MPVIERGTYRCDRCQDTGWLLTYACPDCPAGRKTQAPQQCGLCGAFLPKPKPGARSRVCGRCGTEFEVPPGASLRL